MDWQLLALIPKILFGILFALLMWGTVQMWKIKNKFLAIILLALAVVTVIGFIAIYGKSIFG